MPALRPARILLLQVRQSSAALEHEQKCFAGMCCDRVEIAALNVLEEWEIGWNDVERFDGLILGGSGECSATARYPFTDALAIVVQRWVAEGRPFLGSCWGHHFLATALGGEVRTDLETSEIGTFEVELTAAGREDPLFGRLPERFKAQMGHHDFVAELPAGATALAHSERCPNQAIRLAGKPVYTTQFHSELGRRDILDRLAMYKESYLEDTSLDEMRRRVRPSRATGPLIGWFLDVCF